MARPGPFQYPKTVKMAARAARLPSVVLTLAAPPASEPIISIGCFKVKQGKIMSNRILSMLFATVILAGGSLALSSCGFGQKSESVKSQSQAGPQGGPGQGGQGGPRLGQKAMGGAPVDKSGDKKLQALIKEVVPKFRQLVYVDATTGDTIEYNLFVPKGAGNGSKYPLVLFIADASTPGLGVKVPLTQGYGGLVWATDEFQAEHPCYVLVPQFPGVAVDDSYRHTPQVDDVMRLVRKLAAEQDIDTERMYSTGQSMGGMISMYYAVRYSGVFAAYLFVDSPWNPRDYDRLVRNKFIWVLSGNTSKAYAELGGMENACREEGISYTFAMWDARLPETTQSATARAMLDKGAPVNIFEFTPKSVLPPDGKGVEHMYSFDYAYRVPAFRTWLFSQKK